MSNKKQLLPLDGCANLLEKLVGDFAIMSKSNSALPNKRTYKVASSVEPYGVARSARKAAFLRLSSEYSEPIRKNAFCRYDQSDSSLGLEMIKGFDARRIDQETERNPRQNFQNYNRSQQYIDGHDQKRLEAFARLVRPLEAIKNKFGTSPEYFQSHARKLRESVKSILKVRESDIDIFRPQMDYLEQLLYARYRISTEDLEKMSSEMLEKRVLSKDEDLLKRGSFMHITGDDENNEKQANVVKDGDKSNDDLIRTLFGTSRRDGEKTIERTVTITIRDSVIE